VLHLRLPTTYWSVFIAESRHHRRRRRTAAGVCGVTAHRRRRRTALRLQRSGVEDAVPPALSGVRRWRPNYRGAANCRRRRQAEAASNAYTFRHVRDRHCSSHTGRESRRAAADVRRRPQATKAARRVERCRRRAWGRLFKRRPGRDSATGQYIRPGQARKRSAVRRRLRLVFHVSRTTDSLVVGRLAARHYQRQRESYSAASKPGSSQRYGPADEEGVTRPTAEAVWQLQEVNPRLMEGGWQARDVIFISGTIAYVVVQPFSFCHCYLMVTMLFSVNVIKIKHSQGLFCVKLDYTTWGNGTKIEQSCFIQNKKSLWLWDSLDVYRKEFTYRHWLTIDGQFVCVLFSWMELSFWNDYLYMCTCIWCLQCSFLKTSKKSHTHKGFLFCVKLDCTTWGDDPKIEHYSLIQNKKYLWVWDFLDVYWKEFTYRHFELWSFYCLDWLTIDWQFLYAFFSWMEFSFCIDYL